MIKKIFKTTIFQFSEKRLIFEENVLKELVFSDSVELIDAGEKIILGDDEESENIKALYTLKQAVEKHKLQSLDTENFKKTLDKLEIIKNHFIVAEKEEKDVEDDTYSMSIFLSQIILSQLGYFQEEIDGKYLDNADETIETIATFQEKYGIDSSGTLNSITINKLIEQGKTLLW